MAIDERLLSMLLGGGQAVDPTAAFLTQAFLEGKTPGDPGAAMQNVLTNLAPGVVAERAAGGAGIGEQLGLEEEEAMKAIMQELGLMMTPVQEATTGVAQQKMISDFLFKQAEAGRDTRELERKERETVLKEEEAPGKRARDEAMTDYYGQLRAGNEVLMNQRARAMNLREMARSGVDELGRPLSTDEQRIVMALAGITATDPSKLRLASSMLASGVQSEREMAAQIIGNELGMDTSAIADPPGFFLNFLHNRFPSFFAEASQEIPGRSGIDNDEMQQMQELMEQNRLRLEELLKE